jgi:hypothetical protein
LQAIPLYLFSALATPKRILKVVKNIQRNFLWQGAQSSKKWALVAWNTICLPKSNGGLGIRDPELLNKTMGAKTWWRWLQQKDEPWSRLWKHKYVSQIDGLDLIRMIDSLQAPSSGTQLGKIDG